MDFVQTHAKEIVALLVPFVTWVLTLASKGRVKLLWASPHSFTFLLQEPLRDADGNVVQKNQTVNTASIRVVNSGRETATKLEMVFNWKPQFLNLWPVRHYEEYTEADDRYILIFDSLAPKEDIGLEIMCINSKLPELIQVRSHEGVGHAIPMTWVRKVPPSRVRILLFLAALGLATAVYFGIALFQYLVLKTPPVL